MVGLRIARQRNADRWPAVADVVLAVCLAAIAVLVARQAVGQDRPGAFAPSAWWEWGVVVLPSSAVAFRRTAPLWATPVAVVGQMLVWGLDLAEVFVAPLVMIYSVTTLGGRLGVRIGTASALALSAMSALGVAIAPDVGFGLFALTALASAVALILGVNVATQRQESADLASELAVAQIEQEMVRERAVVRERERIVHELHDLVGHSLSVIAVRAEAAQRVGATRPEVTADAIAAIADTARGSLAEVRRVLHTVREDGDVELAPLPTLRDLGDLVQRIVSSGVDVELRVGEPADTSHVDTATGAGVYRIVQEALTNVIKHAGPAASAVVDVDVDLTDGVVRVTVTDDGRGPRTAVEESGGMGIAGMTERAEVLGGTLAAGAAPGGGFRIRAAIPIGASA